MACNCVSHFQHQISRIEICAYENEFLASSHRICVVQGGEEVPAILRGQHYFFVA